MWVSVKATRTVTVLQLRKKLCRKNNHSLHETVLVCRGQQMDDDKPLAFYNVTGVAPLELKVSSKSNNCTCTVCQQKSRKITVNVVSLSTETRVECTLWDTVRLLKKSVEKAHGIPASRQKLMFNREVLHESRSLHTYIPVDHAAGETVISVQLVRKGPPTLLEKLTNVMRLQKSSTTPTTATVAL
ncbi:ubiquitin-like protein-NEDD8-like protein RUB3 [Physcomitrium patens]|uniref:Ubiquitin-like domain-containing protein n=1 Tax=Physcomitrium patens TaxID=3218 RepID=A0A2K1IJW2_PHYPA|nr:polyubiquitin-like [Physcomitrium patens]PNR29567.1 hypothetical protein PHYPA_028261 [Physcomitrium patens]|eukprot:XP_024362107.1 polyubiquitin-like [Physcomitrella patens]